MTSSVFGVQYLWSLLFRQRGVDHSSFVICGVWTSTMES